MSLTQWYHYINTELADPRSSDWFLVRTPVPLILITSSYLYFVLKCGPRYMENKKPYSFKSFIRFYNVFQIVVNAWIVYRIFDIGWYESPFLYCIKMDYSNSLKAIQASNVIWYVLVVKYIDYIETILFVLRKKQRQVSVLHLYHHVSTVIIGHIAAKYYCDIVSLSVAIVNSSVHVIMYTYYLLASFGPKIQRMLNHIKPMITIIQMVQLSAMILYICQGFTPSCKELRVLAFLMFVNLVINLYLFYRFYRETYLKKTKRS